MSLSPRLPGTRAGHSIRNAFVLLIVYPIAIALLIVASPLLIGVATGYNYRGLRDRLGFLPGISDDRAIKSAVIAGGYGVLLLVGVATVGGAAAGPSSPENANAAATTTTVETPNPTTTQGATTAAATTTTATTTKTTTDTSTTTATSTTSSGELVVTVTEVVDGDTVDIKYQNGTLDTVRLLGVDTPETSGGVSPEEFEGVPDTEAGRACLRDAADQATSFTRLHLEGETITLRFDEESDRRGYYGRLLAYVFHDGENLNYQLVTEGHARVYTDGEFTQEARFLDAEESAQQVGSGLWTCQDATSSTTTASGDASLSVSVHEDAQGDEYDNLDDEYVTLTNKGDAAVDLSGWTIRDDDGHEYVVPDGVVLDAGASLTLYTGKGSSSESELYWGREAPVWNNGGDVVVVEDDGGSEVVHYEYE